MRDGLAWLAATLVASAAPAAELRLQPATSEIAFTSRQMGVPVQGRFRNFEAEVDFDPARPEAARIALRIALASAAIGTAETEAELAKPGWFDTRRFPSASFVASTVRPAGPERFDIGGKLTLKGTSRELVVPVTLARTGTQTVADAVEVRFRLTLIAP